MIVFDISIILTILSIVLVFMFSYLWEKRDWNNGICPDNGQPWEMYDQDSHGSRMYKSGNADRMSYTEISWPVDRRRY